jgi:hypothetical protein
MSTEPTTTTDDRPTGTITVAHTLVDDRLGTFTVDREVNLADLFGPDGRLVLFSDTTGWSGIVYEDGQLYQVNKRHHDDEPISKEPITRAKLRERIESHIADPHAGGVGTFATGASPP